MKNFVSNLVSNLFVITSFIFLSLANALDKNQLVYLGFALFCMSTSAIISSINGLRKLLEKYHLEQDGTNKSE
jgi:hypothetical protein